ncbi:hypothetical protein D3C71_2000180 [compost metagenome]
MRRYTRSNGTRIKVLITQALTEASVMTKVVAMPMPMALSSFLETPRNGHRPRNFTRTKLFTSTVPTNRSRYSVIAMPKKIKAAYYRELAA